VPEDKLVRTLIRHAEQLMGDTEMLHFDIRVEVVVHERLEV
jgi:hypothetical protein